MNTNPDACYVGGTDIQPIIKRFDAALAMPYLSLSVAGGGVAEPQTLTTATALIVDRADVEAVVMLLKANDLVPR